MAKLNNSQKCVYITFVGSPNAGKSTLMNSLVGSKVSIVTPKVQTTRIRVTAINTIGDTQIIYVDTPGIFKPNKQLDKSMVKAAWGGLRDSDFSALLIDVKRGIDENTPIIMRGMAQRGGRNILILNKVDLVEKAKLLALASELNQNNLFEATFMVSALKGNGIDDLQQHLINESIQMPWPYAEDQLTDLPMRMFAAETTREKLMLRLDQELPYNLMVDTESWEESKPNKKNPNGSVTIKQVIYVTNENHKKIVVGRAGQNIKKIGEMSRKELQWSLDMKVNLFLFVKVKGNWLTNPEHYRMMGLDM